MKKVLFILLCCCSIFILGCNGISDEFDEMSFDEVLRDIEYVNNNQQNQNNNDIVKNALTSGMEQRNAGNFDVAIEIYTKAIELVPNNAGLYADRGRVNREKGDLDSALEDVNKALDLSPEEGWIYAERAVAYQVKGEKELALRDYKKALELDPNIDWVKQSIQKLEEE